MYRFLKRGILVFFCAVLTMGCVSCKTSPAASPSAAGTSTPSAHTAENTAAPSGTAGNTAIYSGTAGQTGGAVNSASAQPSPSYSALPARPLGQIYGQCVIVYGNNARQYEKLAAQSLYEFIKDEAETQILAAEEYKAPGDKNGLPALTVYVGDTGLEKPDKVWQSFNKNGYIMNAEENSFVFRGSSAENTYIAVSRYINQLMQKNPDNISTWDMASGVSAQFESASREEYIADISKFETVWQYEWQPPEWIMDFEGKLKDFTDSSARPISYAHRGDIESYPENSIEGVISAVKKGADMLELDVYMTRDKVLVLNHGEDLNATTDWAEKRGKTVNGVKLPASGNITAWTYEQLCQLRLRTGNGEYSDSKSEITEYMIPTLKEVFTVCNERSLLILDRVSSAHWDKIFDIIKETGACRCFTYTTMARSLDEAYNYQAIVKAEFGKSAPTCFARGCKWTGCGRIDHYYEFSLETQEEFDEYFKEEIKYGCFVMTNRLSELIDFIDRHYAPGD